MSSKKTQVNRIKKLSYAGTILAFFIFGLLLLFPRAASFLVKTSPAIKTDAAFILMGSVSDRLLQAADLYEAGLAKQIILVNEKQTGMEFLIERGVQIPSLAALSKQALIDLGIPDSLITILPGQASSTRAEADSLASYLSHNPHIKSITLVSSAYHLRRAALIFEDAFSDNKLNINIYTAPSPYSSFQTDKWYTHRESAKQVFMEYAKITSFLLVEQWQ
jgi:uncharacterized SAM-binding protein YcdF (DUF218 family)